MRLNHFIAACGACCSVFAAEEPLYLSVFKDIATTQEGNVLFSPACLEDCLLYVGKYTAGQTQAEIKALRFSACDKNTAMKPQMAYGLFVADDVKLKNEKADVVRVPFATDTRAALQKINDWLENATGNLLHCNVDADAVQTDTRLFFVSALSLEEGWVETFVKDKTIAEYPFTGSDGKVLRVPMMVAEDSTMHHYAEGEDWQAVLLAVHKNRESKGQHCGVFIGIRPRGDVREFAAKLTPELLAHIYKELLRPTTYVENKKVYVRHTDVKLPRFSMLPEKLDFKPMLQKHGVKALFGPQADFSPLTAEQGVFFDSFVQKNGIDVHEDGFSAASCTWGGALGAYHEPVNLYFSITFDKPFIFIIGAAHEKVRPYFMGICENPAEDESAVVYSNYAVCRGDKLLEKSLHNPVMKLLLKSPLGALFEGTPSHPCFTKQYACKLKDGVNPDVLLKIMSFDAPDGGFLQITPISLTRWKEDGKKYAVIRADVDFSFEEENWYCSSLGKNYVNLWFEITEE